jgi:GWxTD domain-containing protein
MTYKFIIYITVTFLISISSLFAVKFEFLQYKYSDGKTLLELNYQMKVSDLLYKNTENTGIQSNTKFGFVLSAAGVENINQKWVYTYNKASDDSSLVIFDKKYFSIYPGTYDFKLFYNLGDERVVENAGKITIKDFDKPKTLISDILLAHQLEDFDPDKHNQLFKKGNLFIIPNVENTISGAYPFLKHYFELYNIDISENTVLKLDYTIMTGTQKEVMNISKQKTIRTNSIYEYGLIPVDSLKNGLYRLIVNVYNEDQLIATNNVKFYILDPERDFFISEKFKGSLSFERSPFAIMDEVNIDYEFKTMKFILTEFEIDKYESLTTLRAKQRAIYNYWSERDTDTTTLMNERMSEYKERISFANKYFSRGDILPGWKSERGRILLKYGFPTNREIYRQRGEKKAAEEWQYDELFGGSYFFFIDRFNDNSFLLVHSTTPGEVKNYNWFNEFNPAIDNDGSPRYNSSRNIEK